MGLSALTKMIKEKHKEETKTNADKFVDAINKYLLDINDMDYSKVQTFYKKVLDRLLKDWNAEDIEYKGFTFRSSSAGNCKRSLFYQMIDAKKDKKPVSALLRRKFDNGTYAHLRWQCYIAHMIYLGDYGISWIDWEEKEDAEEREYCFWQFFDKHVEPSLENEEYNLSGHLDFQLEFEGQAFNIDFKTIMHNSTYHSTGFDMLIDIHDDYKAQFTSYSILTGIDSTLVLYESKETQEIKVFQFDTTDEAKQEYLESRKYITDIYNDYKAGLVKEIPLEYELSKCWKCDYKGICDRPKPSTTYGKNAINKGTK